MKIRIMGTKDECLLATNYYRALEKEENVQYVQVSDLYPNRGSSTLYRVYIEVAYYWIDEEAANAPGATLGVAALPNGRRRK